MQMVGQRSIIFRLVLLVIAIDTSAGNLIIDSAGGTTIDEVTLI